MLMLLLSRHWGEGGANFRLADPVDVSRVSGELELDTVPRLHGEIVDHHIAVDRAGRNPVALSCIGSTSGY